MRYGSSTKLFTRDSARDEKPRDRHFIFTKTISAYAEEARSSGFTFGTVLKATIPAHSSNTWAI